MSVVAITGVSGFVGQGLVRRLTSSPAPRGSARPSRISGGSGALPRIVGLDIAAPAFRSRDLEMHLVDVTRVDLAPFLEGVDAVVHLAGVHDTIPDAELMARVNVAGTRRVLEAANAAGVRKVILVSSAAVYGAWANNPVPLNEDAPLRPNPGFPLAAHKAEAERLLAEWAPTGPGTVGTVLRMATVVGPRADHAFARLLRSRLPLGLSGAPPPVQFLHEDDAVEALALAVSSDLPGAYNVAADGWLSRDDLAVVLGRRIQVAIPAELAERLLGRLWPAGLADLPPTVLPYLMHPWVVAIDRLRAAGWSPAHSNEEAVLACVEHRPGPDRVKIAAAVALGTGAAAGTILGARRRH